MAWKRSSVRSRPGPPSPSAIYTKLSTLRGACRGTTKRITPRWVGSSLPKHFLAPKCMNDTAECRDFLIFTISAARSNHEH